MLYGIVSESAVPLNCLIRLDDDKILVDTDPTLLIKFSLKFSNPPDDFLRKNFLLFCRLPLPLPLPLDIDDDLLPSCDNELRLEFGFTVDGIKASVDFNVAIADVLSLTPFHGSKSKQARIS